MNEVTNDPSPSENPGQNISPKRIIVQVLSFLKDRLNLSDDQATPKETSDYIRKGVEFNGPNVWILIFAIFIASVGLNMNSTAVVIGAMLISPLMGPIMGIGLGAGVNDFELIKRSAKNLGFMVLISVATSTLYFFLSPISDAQSELLARTQPTIWDVIIALFGGLAGIVAGSRREKSNAIPGVAIATALMPPLCTAGYGLATAQWTYFFGAFYLFAINSVFISVSTLVVVRFLKYPQKEFLDPIRATKVKRWIALFVIVTTLPSLYIAYNLVRDTVFEREAGVFVSENFLFDNAQVISKTVNLDGDVKKIEVALIGEPIMPQVIENIRAKMKLNERLADAELVVRQGAMKEQGLDKETVELMNQSMKSGIIEDLYKRNEEVLQSKEQRIETLEKELIKLRSRDIPVGDISNELYAFDDNVKEFTLMNNAVFTADSMRLDTVMFAYVKFKKRNSDRDKERISNWLQVRTKCDSLRLVVEAN
ncbi:MAG: TIGR00341 family protein [Salibacteraceae bacterium]